MTETARRRCGTRAHELREEADWLRRWPLNRLSFHTVNDRAAVVWRIPTIPAGLPKADADNMALRQGQAMAAELFAALEETSTLGLPQSHMGFLVAKVIQKLDNHAMLVGFTRGLDDGFNSLAMRAPQSPAAVSRRTDQCPARAL